MNDIRIWFRIPSVAEVPSLRQRLDRVSGPPNLLSSECRGWCDQGMKLTSDHHPDLKLRMREFLRESGWVGAKFRKEKYWLTLQRVSLAIEPGISLIILTPMKILHRNLNRSKFVVWEMKRNEERLHTEKIGVWCGMSRRRKIGPILFDATVTTIYGNIKKHL